MAGSMRDRAIASSRASSSGPVSISTTPRGAAIIIVRQLSDEPAYTCGRDRGHPPDWAGIKESVD
jgi:hypothetical protein